MKLDSLGATVGQEIWTRLLAAVDDDLKHRLWCAVIREVATAATRQHPFNDDEESEIEERIKEWQDDALPANNHLAGVLGELDYFREIDLSWDEKIALAGEACGYASEVVWDLANRLDGYPDAQEAVTEEAVEDFYIEWRTRFLRKVLDVTETMSSSSGTDA